MFAFASKETMGIEVYPQGFQKENFLNYWNNEYGVQVKDDVSLFLDGPGISPTDINKGIAWKHRLVLYQGKKGEDLKRIWP